MAFEYDYSIVESSIATDVSEIFLVEFEEVDVELLCTACTPELWKYHFFLRCVYVLAPESSFI